MKKDKRPVPYDKRKQKEAEKKETQRRKNIRNNKYNPKED